MSLYKCPSCGRSHLDIPDSPPTDTEVGTLTMPNVHTEIKCPACGWFGTLEELKTGR